MRVVMITRHGGPEVLEVQERPDPVMAPGHVRIEVAAAGVNFADTMARTGLYPDAPKPPMVVGYEVAGTVREVAADVADVTVGDRVMAGTKFGGYASEVVVPVANLVALADRLSFQQGAAIPVNYATAWAALLGYGSLREGERVLIHAAAGGVGIAATQIAKRLGAIVHGTRVGPQARPHPLPRRGRGARLPAGRLGPRSAGIVRPRARRRRRRFVPPLVQAPAPGRAARRLRRLQPPAR